MKTTLFALLAVSLLLGGCGAGPLHPALGGAPDGHFAKTGSHSLEDHATLAWNGAGKALAPPPPSWMVPNPQSTRLSSLVAR